MDSHRKLEKDAQEFWGSAEVDERIRTYAHWHENALRQRKWNADGQFHLEMFIQFFAELHRAGIHVGSRRMIEWGVGGGMNAVQFSSVFKEIIGVDVSSATHEEFRERMAELGTGVKAHTIAVTVGMPEFAFMGLEDGEADFFLCTAVLQHFPHKDMVRRVMLAANILLRTPGFAIVQIRRDSGSAEYRTKTADYCNAKNAIRFVSYKEREFTKVCEGAGFKLFKPPQKAPANYLFYFLVKDDGKAQDQLCDYCQE